MRSRFAAYAKGRVDYIIATTDPTSPHWQDDREKWRHEVQYFCEVTRFEGLAILEAPPPADEHGTVSFRAELSHDGKDVSIVENSSFRRREGRWFYVEGLPDSATG